MQNAAMLLGEVGSASSGSWGITICMMLALWGSSLDHGTTVVDTAETHDEGQSLPQKTLKRRQ